MYWFVWSIENDLYKYITAKELLIVYSYSENTARQSVISGKCRYIIYYIIYWNCVKT